MASVLNPATNADIFDSYFRRADLDRDGRISGLEAVSFFPESGLPKPVLSKEGSVVGTPSGQSQSEEIDDEALEISKCESIIWLTVMTAWISFSSDYLVDAIEVIYDKETSRSRGFGFVTMSSSEEVEAATQQLNDYVSGLDRLPH